MQGPGYITLPNRGGGRKAVANRCAADFAPALVGTELKHPVQAKTGCDGLTGGFHAVVTVGASRRYGKKPIAAIWGAAVMDASGAYRDSTATRGNCPVL